MTGLQNQMGTKPVLPLLMSMALPPMLSMLIQSMYNVVDGIFVARLSNEAFTAVSLAYPLQNMTVALAVGFGVGANAFIARQLGEGDTEKVNHAASMGMLFTLLHSLLFAVIGWSFSRPFLQMFTQDAQVLQMSVEYARIVVCLCFGSMFHIYVEKLFQATGNMLVPMILQGVGAVINIVLDPVFIFGMFGMPALGVKGAAIATVIGQVTAGTIAMVWFFASKSSMSISLRQMIPDKTITAKIYGVAIPSTVMGAMPSVLVSVMNAVIAEFHVLAVAVFGMYFKLQTFVYMPANGLIQGMRPLVSYNYGAGKGKRMNQVVYWSLVVTAILMGIGTMLFWLLPRQIMQVFGADAQMMELGVSMLRLTSLGFLVSTLGTVLAGCFEALGYGVQSLLITLLRQLFIIPPLAMLLGSMWGLDGVWVAFPVAELLSALVAVALYKSALSKMNQTRFKAE